MALFLPGRNLPVSRNDNLDPDRNRSPFQKGPPVAMKTDKLLPRAPAPASPAAPPPEANTVQAREPAPAQTDAFVARTSAPAVKISTYNDDPFALPSHVESMKGSHFEHDKNGKVVGLEGDRAVVIEDPAIYIADDKTGRWVPFSTNPWELPKPDAMGNFVFPTEDRFPTLERELGADGKVKTDKDGLQVWTPNENHVGQTTAFQGVNDVGDAGEKWSGRKILWGDNGQLAVFPHAFVGFNAFYSGASRDLNFGIVPYKLPGSDEIKLFEMATSWEVGAHESGHALHHELKPNMGPVDPGFRQWGESFADQTAMWTSLSDAGRRKQILAETHGDMSQPSDLSRLGELMAGLTGQGDALRDMINDKTVTNTSNEFHDRAEVLNGAVYDVFVGVYNDLRDGGLTDDQALKEAGEIMGKLNVRACDHTPENFMTQEDVCKGYLSADQELNGGRYHDLLVKNFAARGLIDDTTEGEWSQHQANLPNLHLPSHVSVEKAVADLVKDSQGKLGVGPELGYKVQSIETTKEGEKIVRLTLTDKQPGKKEQELANNALLVFRKDGTLAEFQPAIPEGLSQFQVVAMMEEARKAGLDQKGVIGLVPNPPPPPTKEDPYPAAPGGYTVQVVKEFTDKADPHLMVYDLKHPEGVRREYAFNEREPNGLSAAAVAALLPSGAQLVSPSELKAAQVG